MVDIYKKYLSDGFRYATASKPKGDTAGCTKLRLRPVKIRGCDMFQVTRTVGTKEVHENLDKDEAALLLSEITGNQFLAVEAENMNGKLCVLVSKKGHVTVKEHPNRLKTDKATDTTETVHNRAKNYLLKEGEPIPFLIELGVMTSGGKVVAQKYDKFRQINRYLEFVEDIIPSLPKERELRIIDFGCGKSYLTFALYYFLHEINGYDVRITGLDLKDDVIENCSKLTERLGYKGLKFLKGDIAGLNLDEDNRPDMVVTLHACDTATDYALEKAVKWGAKVILCVPCCQHELNRQIDCDELKPILKYGLLKERFAAIATDALRAEMLEESGYRTQVLEFIDMEHTPKNILIRAVRQPLKIKKHTGYEKTTEFLHVKPTLQKLLFGFALLFCFLMSGFIKANAATDIRVGLKALYSGKSIITCYNTELKMGYCLKDSYKADIVLKSAGGFSFEPDKGKYYSNLETYGSYSEAAAGLRASGSSGYICYVGRNKWMAYIKSEVSGYSKVASDDVIKLSFGKKTILIDGSVSGGYPQFAPSGKETTISLGSRSYRGRIEIGRYGLDSLTAVNIVNIESYLLSVVSCEMSTSWHSEAQKAQAIAARSYCLANTGFGADSSIKKGYVIVDTSESQVYAGVGKESDISKYAVNTTLKQVLYSKGRVLPAYYFSTSGGATEFSSDIWGGNDTSFVGVFDEYETNPERAPWIIKTTFEELQKKLNNKGYNIGSIIDIYPELLSDSGRVTSVRIKHDGGSISVKGSIIKSLYDMSSTKFKIITPSSEDFEVSVRSMEDTETVENSDLNIISGTGQISSIKQGTNQMIVISKDNMTNFPVERPGEGEIWFLGMGSGHGIGMSQSGAYGMALKGYKYDEILKYYYRNTDIASY